MACILERQTFLAFVQDVDTSEFQQNTRLSVNVSDPSQLANARIEQVMRWLLVLLKKKLF